MQVNGRKWGHCSSIEKWQQKKIPSSPGSWVSESHFNALQVKLRLCISTMHLLNASCEINVVHKELSFIFGGGGGGG